MEQAIRGLWPTAIEEARKVLAQAGGDDDVARMIIATGHMHLEGLMLHGCTTRSRTAWMIR